MSPDGGDRDDARRGRRRVVVFDDGVVVLAVSGFGAAFAFSATGAGVPSTSSEKTNATATSDGTRSEDKCERPHGRLLSGGRR